MDYPLRQLLQEQGWRITTPRLTVFAVLKAHPALSLPELRAATRGRLDTASLYRTLGLFRRLGIVQDVVIGGKRKMELSDRFGPHHHHLTCVSCGVTVSIRNERFEAQIGALAAARGWQHRSHSFEVTGLCPSCQRPASTT